MALHERLVALPLAIAYSDHGSPGIWRMYDAWTRTTDWLRVLEKRWNEAPVAVKAMEQAYVAASRSDRAPLSEAEQQDVQRLAGMSLYRLLGLPRPQVPKLPESTTKAGEVYGGARGKPVRVRIGSIRRASVVTPRVLGFVLAVPVGLGKCSLREAIPAANLHKSIHSCPAVQGAFTADNGAGITNAGALTIRRSIVTGNVSYSTAGRFDLGGDFAGGGIANAGTLNVMESSIRDNSADRGGGVWNAGQMRVIASTIANNVASGECIGSTGFPSFFSGCFKAPVEASTTRRT